MSNHDSKRRVSTREAQAKEGKTPGQVKPRSPYRETMGEEPLTRQKQTLDKPRRKPTIIAKAALAAGIAAATLLGGQSGANAARIPTDPHSVLAMKNEKADAEIYYVEPPSEYNTLEPGNDLHSLLEKINGPAMKLYEVSGEPGKYRLPMDNGKTLQVKMINGGKELAVWQLSRSGGDPSAPLIDSAYFLVSFRYLGLKAPKLHVMEGPKFLHITAVDEPTGKQLRIMVPKDSVNLEGDLLVQMFSLDTTHREIISSLAKLPRITSPGLPKVEIARPRGNFLKVNSLFEKAQAQIEKGMPALPTASTDPQKLKPVTLLLDDVISVYEVALNSMIDSLNREMEGMKKAEKKQFLDKMLPYAVGALLRPYQVSYNGIDHLSELDLLLSNPGLDSRELQRFANNNDLAPEYKTIMESFLSSFR